ncbi:NAD+ kinase [Acrasis kona]|uniref:NAD+ kinase n=1 Tax=Acrasis kona TaxID=1008807 RepID=A0AAW2ZPS2_9EUKA
MNKITTSINAPFINLLYRRILTTCHTQKRFTTKIQNLQHKQIPFAQSSPFEISFHEKPKTALLFCKINNTAAFEALSNIANHLTEQHNVKIIVEDSIHKHFSQSNSYHFVIKENLRGAVEKSDFIICSGGDGTMLYLHSLLSQLDIKIPPFLSFVTDGSLGFLLPHQLDEYKNVVDRVMNDKVISCTSRMRLDCDVYRSGEIIKKERVLNEVVVHRGNIFNPSIVQTFIDDYHFTTMRGDGLIVATPTGSTGYSSSSSGAMVHPSLQCINITPICSNIPLSIKPVVVPNYVSIKLQMSDGREFSSDTVHNDSGDVGIVAFDGRSSISLRKHDILHVKKSEFDLITIDRDTSMNDWMDSVNKRFKFKIH